MRHDQRGDYMKIMVMALGFLTIFAGVLPMVSKFWTAIPASLVTGYAYMGLVVALGILALVYGIMNFGFGLDNIQQFVVGLYGILLVIGGLLPLFAKMTTIIPVAIVTGYLYYGIIIAIGVGGIAYGASQF